MVPKQYLLSTDPAVTFRLENMVVNAKVYNQGQSMLNRIALLPELVNHGVRLMAYTDNIAYGRYL